MVGGTAGPVEAGIVVDAVLAVVEATDEELDVVVAMVPLPNAYMFKRLGPPQYSVWLLLQAMLQSVAAALIDPLPSLLSQ
jgi:hypothetical protein